MVDEEESGSYHAIKDPTNPDSNGMFKRADEPDAES